jgi:hypothetical protein
MAMWSRCGRSEVDVKSHALHTSCAPGKPLIGGIPSTDRTSQFAKVGETTLYEVRIEMVLTSDQQFYVTLNGVPAGGSAPVGPLVGGPSRFQTENFGAVEVRTIDVESKPVNVQMEQLTRGVGAGGGLEVDAVEGAYLPEGLDQAVDGDRWGEGRVGGTNHPGTLPSV